MTVTTTDYGYLERPYLEDTYLTGVAWAQAGMQAEFVIEADDAQGQQAEFTIVDFEDPQGMQSEFVIEAETAYGQQAEFSVVDEESAYGMQVDPDIEDHTSAYGMQVSGQVLDFLRPYGSEVRSDKGIVHTECGYLEGDYLEDAYLVKCKLGNIGMQCELQVNAEDPYGSQAEFTIVDFEDPKGMQALFNIVDFLDSQGIEIDSISVSQNGMQATVSIYNTTNLRILCDFLSRGAKTTGGTNAWGNDIGTGENWMSNSTEPGDFTPFNLNTDIVEQYWRSATGVVTGVNLDCDTEINQGVFLDTFAMLGHNLTTSANVTLIGSDVDDFSVVGVAIPLPAGEDNTYYIAPTLPNTGYRYWRISIDDATNPDGFLKIGTVIFGAAEIFQGECFVDELEFQLKDFADTVRTEGFTNVANSRTLKKLLGLEFRFLNTNKGNFQTLRDMFNNERTVLKCLWIPTPQEDNDQDFIGRFAVFGKLSTIPRERHANRGQGADYVSFSIEVDESL